MNLIEYVRIAVRRGWIAIVLAVLAAVAVFAFSQTLTPMYRSTQTMLIVPSRSDFGLTQAAVQLLNQRRTYLDSDLIAQQIIDDLQLDMTPGYLRSRTTITAQRDNLTIVIDVDMPANDFGEAVAFISPIADAWGEQLVRYQEQLNQDARREDRIQAQRQDNPRVAQLRPQPTLYAAIGGIAGLFVGVVIILVLEYLDNNMVRRREDLERDELPVLAVVPQE